MAGQQQQAPQQQAPEVAAPEVGQEAGFEQERGNAAAQQDAGLAGAAPPEDDGKLRQAHGDHLRLRAEAAEAQKKLAKGIEAIAGELAEGDCKLAQPLCDPDKIKKIPRSEEKIQYNYGGDASRLTDIARGSIVFADELEVRQSFPKICAKVEGLGWTVVGDVKDRFLDPASGYRDMLMNVEIDGHICELQLHVKCMAEAKGDERGHGNYNTIRGLDVEQRKNGSLRPDQLDALSAATSDMEAFYNDEWAQHEGEMKQDPARFAELERLRAEARQAQA